MTNHNKLLGYARVSTDGQDLGSQIDQLQRAGCDTIYTEHASGASAKNLVELGKCIASAAKGDTIVVTELSRFGRSLKDLLLLLDSLSEQGIEIKSLKENLDTTSPLGRLMFQMLGSFSEFERNIISDRTKRALKFKKANGIIPGPKPKFTKEQDLAIYLEYKNTNTTFKELGKKYNVVPSIIFRSVQRAQEYLQSKQKAF